jgi:ribosomal protein L31E
MGIDYQQVYQCIKIIVANFRESGSIITKKSALVRIPEVVQNVQQIVEKHPSTSIRRLKQQVNLSYNTCQKILKKDINSFPYKIGVLHEIKPEDYPKRMINITEFCQSISPE